MRVGNRRQVFLLLGISASFLISACAPQKPQKKDLLGFNLFKSENTRETKRIIDGQNSFALYGALAFEKLVQQGKVISPKAPAAKVEFDRKIGFETIRLPKETTLSHELEAGGGSLLFGLPLENLQ